MSTLTLVRDPSTNKLINFKTYFRRVCATIRLQRFYLHYIKWEHDEKGWPIDPILKCSFDPKLKIRILYQSKLGSRYVTRLQCYNIETIWEVIHYTNKPINPITNTQFTSSQFRQILEKAAKHNYIKDHEIGTYMSKFGYGIISHNPVHHHSSYEPPVDPEAEAIIQTIKQDQHLLAYYALLNDLTSFNQIIYSHLEDINNGDFDINFQREPGKPIPSVFNKDQPMIDPELEKKNLPPYLHIYNALQAGCVSGNNDIILFLLQLGAHLTIQDPLSEVMPLHIVLYENHIKALKILILYGSRKHLEYDSKYGTPLELASRLLDNYPDIYHILYGEFHEL